METNDIRSTAIEFAKFCIKSIGLEVADTTLQNDFDKFITKQKLPIHSVSGKRPMLTEIQIVQAMAAVDEARQKLEALLAACASGAVDKTVSLGKPCPCCGGEYGHLYNCDLMK